MAKATHLFVLIHGGVQFGREVIATHGQIGFLAGLSLVVLALVGLLFLHFLALLLPLLALQLKSH